MGIPVEIERKFVIAMPDFDYMASLEDYTSSEIRQTYLMSTVPITHRVRARRFADVTTYTETVKRRIDSMSVFEDEREISEVEYQKLLQGAMDGTVTLEKTRHSFVFCGKTFEVDVYPKWQKSCILEVELLSRDEEITFPEFITVIAEVTGDKRYSNASLSRSFPVELI